MQTVLELSAAAQSSSLAVVYPRIMRTRVLCRPSRRSPDESCTDRAQDVPVRARIMANEPDAPTRSRSSEHTRWIQQDVSDPSGST